MKFSGSAIIKSMRERGVRGMARFSADRFFGGWFYGAQDEASACRRRILLYGYGNNFVLNLVGGSFYIGLLLLMGADDSFLGLVSMIPVAAGMLQLFSPLILERFAKRRKLVMGGHLLAQTLSVILVGVSAFMPLPTQGKLLMAGSCIALSSIISSLIAPGMGIWHLQWLPQQVRGSYFATVTMTTGVFVALFNLGASTLVDAFRVAGKELIGLMLLRGISIVIIVGYVILLLRVPERPYEQAEGRLSLRDLFLKPIREKKYLPTIAVAFLWSFAANLPGPYFTAYLLSDVGVNYTTLTLVSLLNIPALLFITPLWAKLARKVTYYRLVSIGMSGYVLHWLSLLFVNKQTLLLYPITTGFAYCCLAGVTLAFASIPYQGMPEKNQTAFLGFYSTCANVAGLLGLTVSRFFMSVHAGRVFHFFTLTIPSRQLVVGIGSVAMLVGALLVYIIDRHAKHENSQA